MLLTLLGEFVLPAEGAAWTSAVLAAFERLGVAEKATRQALMRTSNAGWLKPDKVGRRTRWQLTPAARRLLTDGAERIYSFGPAHDWDGTWVLVQVRIPDSDRRARHEVRTRLAWAGYGSLGPGLWISPHAAREREAVRALTEAGVADDAHVFTARRTGLSDARAMVAAAWDLPAVGAEYDLFSPSSATRRRLTCSPGSSSWCTPGAGPLLDPSLPPELVADAVERGRRQRGCSPSAHVAVGGWARAASGTRLNT